MEEVEIRLADGGRQVCLVEKQTKPLDSCGATQLYVVKTNTSSQ